MRVDARVVACESCLGRDLAVADRDVLAARVSRGTLPRETIVPSHLYEEIRAQDANTLALRGEPALLTTEKV